ncbi:transposase [Streptosporangium canum]|uniref:transposase n=1 Tax=Streptosporangium canum TaxID=324952 RepID=UPI0037B24A68
MKAPPAYSRGTDKSWVYGGLRICDGIELTFCAPSRDSDGWIGLLQQIARADRRGALVVITDNLSSHSSWKVRQWSLRHPRIRQVFIPVKACRLNLAEGWWRLLRKAAFAGQIFADATESAHAVATATAQLNAHAHPWVWGRPPLQPRALRRTFVNLL